MAERKAYISGHAHTDSQNSTLFCQMCSDLYTLSKREQTARTCYISYINSVKILKNYLCDSSHFINTLLILCKYFKVCLIWTNPPWLSLYLYQAQSVLISSVEFYLFLTQNISSFNMKHFRDRFWYWLKDFAGFTFDLLGF